MLLVQYEPSVVITLASGVHRKFALTRMNVITSIMIVQPAALRYTPDIMIMQVKVSAPLPDRARAPWGSSNIIPRFSLLYDMAYHCPTGPGYIAQVAWLPLLIRRPEQRRRPGKQYIEHPIPTEFRILD